MSKLLAGLNPEQHRAVVTTEGPVLVLAGAGTGKTRVITVRIAHLLARKVAPENVLAVTFTNKAAAEMRERVAGLVGKKRAEELTIGTFHAFCLRALREHGTKLGLPRRFAICDASDQVTAVKGALRELKIPEATIQPGLLQSKISLLKNRLVDPEQFLAQAADDRDELIGRAYRRYEDHLRRSASLDFDDLLVFTVRLLAKSDEVRTAYQQRFRYAMVDEYQDTNGPQYEIVRSIAGGHRNLCVVGDDDQSIYGWRGADVTKILGFDKDFPDAAVVRLETNYRSTEPILAAANRVIANNPSRHEKTLRSAVGPGEPVRMRVFKDEEAEADDIVREILEDVRKEKARYGDFAILFRTATQPRTFEAQLRARAVPYVLVGGMSFFDRKEVRDVLAYLRLCANPDDEVSLLRILNCPPRGIGRSTIERLLAHATAHGISAARTIRDPEAIAALPDAARSALGAFRATLDPFTKADPGRRLVDWIHQLLGAVDYKAEVTRAYPDQKTRDERWNAVQEVLNFAENHVRRTKQPTLNAFLQELTLTATDDRTAEDPGKRDVVTLMTLHSAKGLEFPTVYLVGMEEGLLPHARSVAEDGIEEERRLAYVGITRARWRLTMTYAASRARYGTRVESHPSRFMFEVKGEPPPKTWRAIDSSEPVKPTTPAARKKAAKKKATRKRAQRR
jgi:DNA helicase-2/ATP-dependent DNA helicase PcrA